MIKVVIFDLDNTLTDFMRMKENAVDAAVSAMVDAGLRVPPDKVKKKIYQIYDKKGIEFQHVFDVALSDGRRPLFGRFVRDLDSTVDSETGTWRNDVGDAELRAMWRDPAFDPDERAFYYARVIEIARPRWNVYDAVRLGAKVPNDVPTEVKDRAYSSPIWYAP